jgi:NTE family protein
MLNHPDVVKTVADAKAQVAKHPISDIVDDEGNQYVDLVMEGGGMLGIALVGYTYALEQAGIRFLGVGGTSAGSINALLIAAMGAPAEAKSPAILEELCAKNFHDFIDGSSDARDFIDSAIAGKGPVVLAFKAAQVIDDVNGHLGLNPGKDFYNWISDILARRGIHTLAQLKDRLATLPKGLRTRNGKLLDTAEKAEARLALVAADVTTETKVVFPEMAELYFADPDGENPARFVRASMSIPFFFQPYVVNRIPRSPGQEAKWKKHAGLTVDGWKIPTSVTFIDGGIMSNFPIALFHDTTKVPDAPTFGVKLGGDGRKHDTSRPLKLLGAIFNSARHCLDYDFICQNPDYRQLVCPIRVDDYNWLDFGMSDTDKLGLFVEGVLAAGQFLATFDWPAYKKTREGTMVATNAAPDTKGDQWERRPAG